MLNSRGAVDARNVLTGKDGGFYDDEGTLLADVESFHSQANISNTKYHPLGDAQEHEVNTGFGVTLTFSKTLIRDGAFIRGLFSYFKTGKMPSWNFQGVVEGRNGSQERVVYRDCVPSGTIDIQNLSVGDTIKRAWSMFVNNTPELQNELTTN